MFKQVVHLLERSSGGLRKKGPEKESISKVANNEDQVEVPPDVGKSDRGDLTNHCVESEGDHGSDRDSLRSRSRVEYFGRDDPRERATGRGEREVVDPRHDDESPLSSTVIRYSRWELSDQNGGNYERQAVSEIAKYQRPASTKLVDEENTKELSNQSNYVIDGLIFERIRAIDSDLAIDCYRVVLYS